MWPHRERTIRDLQEYILLESILHPEPAYAIGDKVKLLNDIWDDGEEHHPQGYLAYKGDALIVRSLSEFGLNISHEHITDNTFSVALKEVEKVQLCQLLKKGQKQQSGQSWSNARLNQKEMPKVQVRTRWKILLVLQ